MVRSKNPRFLPTPPPQFVPILTKKFPAPFFAKKTPPFAPFVTNVVGGIEGVVDIEEEEEEEEEEELLLLVALLVKDAMEGVGMPPATFYFFVPLFRALMSHPRTDASSSLVTRRPCGMGSSGWAAAKWVATLYNQTVVVYWGQFMGRLVQGLAFVAVDIRLQEIAHGCKGQVLTAAIRVDRDCNGKRIVHSSCDPQKPQILACDGAACPSVW